MRGLAPVLIACAVSSVSAQEGVRGGLGQVVPHRKSTGRMLPLGEWEIHQVLDPASLAKLSLDALRAGLTRIPADAAAPIRTEMKAALEGWYVEGMGDTSRVRSTLRDPAAVLERARDWERRIMAASSPRARLLPDVDLSRETALLFVGDSPALIGVRRIGRDVNVIVDGGQEVLSWSEGERASLLVTIPRREGDRIQVLNYRYHQVNGAPWCATGVIRVDRSGAAARPWLESDDGVTYSCSGAERYRDWLFDLLLRLEGHPVTVGGLLSQGPGKSHDFPYIFSVRDPEHESSSESSSVTSAGKVAASDGDVRVHLRRNLRHQGFARVPMDRGGALLLPFADLGLVLDLELFVFKHRASAFATAQVDRVRAATLVDWEDLPRGTSVELVSIRGDQVQVRAGASPARTIPLRVLTEGAAAARADVQLRERTLSPGQELQLRHRLVAPAGTVIGYSRRDVFAPGAGVPTWSCTDGNERVVGTDGELRREEYPMRLPQSIPAGTWLVRVMYRDGSDRFLACATETFQVQRVASGASGGPGRPSRPGDFERLEAVTTWAGGEIAWRLRLSGDGRCELRCEAHGLSVRIPDARVELGSLEALHAAFRASTADASKVDGPWGLKHLSVGAAGKSQELLVGGKLPAGAKELASAAAQLVNDLSSSFVVQNLGGTVRPDGKVEAFNRLLDAAHLDLEPGTRVDGLALYSSDPARWDGRGVLLTAKLGRPNEKPVSRGLVEVVATSR